MTLKKRYGLLPTQQEERKRAHYIKCEAELTVCRSRKEPLRDERYDRDSASHNTTTQENDFSIAHVSYCREQDSDGQARGGIQRVQISIGRRFG